MLSAKRVAPPVVAPVEFDGKRFLTHGGFGQLQVRIDEQVQVLTIFEHKLDPMLEADVQEDHVESMELDQVSRKVVLKYESKRQFLLCIDTLAVEQVQATEQRAPPSQSAQRQQPELNIPMQQPQHPPAQTSFCCFGR